MCALDQSTGLHALRWAPQLRTVQVLTPRTRYIPDNALIIHAILDCGMQSTTSLGLQRALRLDKPVDVRANMSRWPQQSAINSSKCARQYEFDEINRLGSHCITSAALCVIRDRRARTTHSRSAMPRWHRCRTPRPLKLAMKWMTRTCSYAQRHFRGKLVH